MNIFPVEFELLITKADTQRDRQTYRHTVQTVQSVTELYLQ